MIYSPQEITSFVSKCLGGLDVELSMLHATGNMTARIEDGGSDTLLTAKVGDKEYVVKMKSKAFDDNVGATMNYYGSDTFKQYFDEGKSIFYIRDSYNREQRAYSILLSLKEHFPTIYGAESDGTRSIILMDKIEIDRSPKDDSLADVLYKIHSMPSSEETMREWGINIHTERDYINATALSKALLDGVSRAYPNFPKRIVSRARDFVANYKQNYQKMVGYGRCLCHGDLTINNLSTKGQIKLYDLELATYNNREFDLISYLVHYPIELNESIVESFLASYYNKMGNCIKEREDALKHNLLIYLTTRFHAMMMITLKLNMPYMETSIKNYIFLFNYFAL